MTIIKWGVVALKNTFFKRTWAEINLDSLIYNYQNLRRIIKPETKIMSVVKADAYGHGVRNVALCLQREGTDWFAVSSIDEALQLRHVGIIRPVLILGYTPPEQIEMLYSNNFTQAVYCLDYAEVLSQNAADKGVTVNCHIKVDVGMGRLGFDADSPDAAGEIFAACNMTGLNCTGIFTHFPSADFDGDSDGTITANSFKLFCGVIDALEQKGKKFNLRHCCNSAASIVYPEMQLDMVREGISLYGLWPSGEVKAHSDPSLLKPVMELRTVVTNVKTLKAGDTVSYGRTYTASKPTNVATVCIGYADGYYRSLSGGYMLVHGKRAKIIGRVCMDQIMLDISGIDNVNRGDIVTVAGHDGEECISIDELATLSKTINYEVVSDLSKRVPRIYIKEGRIFDIINYLYE